MSKGKVPDAWDDEWENQADTGSQSTEDIIESLPKLSKAERRAKQAELNRRLWEEAEAPKNNFVVETRNPVPLQSEFKPAVTVLSRKPAPTVIAKKDPVSGIDKLTIEEDDEDDESKPKPLTLEERQSKAAKEREEKQRKYEEARERLFGTSSSASGSGSNTPRATPSPSRASTDKSKGRGRGSRPTSSSGSKSRHLYDPNYAPKPDHIQRKENTGPDSSKAGEEEQILRQPRGPDSSGRGGHGFDRSRKLP